MNSSRQTIYLLYFKVLDLACQCRQKLIVMKRTPLTLLRTIFSHCNSNTGLKYLKGYSLDLSNYQSFVIDVTIFSEHNKPLVYTFVELGNI